MNTEKRRIRTRNLEKSPILQPGTLDPPHETKAYKYAKTTQPHVRRHRFQAAQRLGEANIIGSKYPTYGKKTAFFEFKIRNPRTKSTPLGLYCHNCKNPIPLEDLTERVSEKVKALL